MRISDWSSDVCSSDLVIADPIDARRDADDLADRIRRGVADPIRLPGGETCHIGVSIGVALYPDAGGDGTALLTAADAAMYADKRPEASRVGKEGVSTCRTRWQADHEKKKRHNQ